MIELPEAITLGQQLSEALQGKTITKVFNSNSPHKFTFFYGDPLTYNGMLVGKKILSAQGRGIFVDMLLDHDTGISFNDGAIPHYGKADDQIPSKYQLLLTFDDESFLAFTVAMYAGIAAYKGSFDNIYHERSVNEVSPLSSKFDEVYFEHLIGSVKKNCPVKAFLSTEQRIPGLGNGVLQDILFNALINPKRKIQSLNNDERDTLFKAIRSTLEAMLEGGGRDTEKDIYGNKGRYATIMSKNTYNTPCPRCGGTISKENYLGGSVYYCINCQKL